MSEEQLHMRQLLTNINKKLQNYETVKSKQETLAAQLAAVNRQLKTVIGNVTALETQVSHSIFES